MESRGPLYSTLRAVLPLLCLFGWCLAETPKDLLAHLQSRSFPAPATGFPSSSPSSLSGPLNKWIVGAPAEGSSLELPQHSDHAGSVHRPGLDEGTKSPCLPGGAPSFLILRRSVSLAGNAWEYRIRLLNLLPAQEPFRYMELASGPCWDSLLMVSTKDGRTALAAGGGKKGGVHVLRSYIFPGKAPNISAVFHVSLLSSRADCCGDGGCSVRAATTGGCFHLAPSRLPAVTRKILSSIKPAKDAHTVAPPLNEDDQNDPDPAVHDHPVADPNQLPIGAARARSLVPACMPRPGKHMTCSVASGSFSSLPPGRRSPRSHVPDEGRDSESQLPAELAADMAAETDRDDDPDSEDAGADPAQAGYFITLESVTTTGEPSQGFMRTWNYRVCASVAGRTGCLAQMTLASCSSSTFRWSSPAWHVAAAGADGTTLLWWNPNPGAKGEGQAVCGNLPGCSSSRLAWFMNHATCHSTCQEVSLSAHAMHDLDLPLTCRQVPISFAVAWGWGHVQGCGVAGPCPDCQSGRCSAVDPRGPTAARAKLSARSSAGKPTRQAARIRKKHHI